jgi:hypothetical protein
VTVFLASNTAVIVGAAREPVPGRRVHSQQVLDV